MALNLDSPKVKELYKTLRKTGREAGFIFPELNTLPAHPNFDLLFFMKYRSDYISAQYAITMRKETVTIVATVSTVCNPNILRRVYNKSVKKIADNDRLIDAACSVLNVLVDHMYSVSKQRNPQFADAMATQALARIERYLG